MISPAGAHESFARYVASLRQDYGEVAADVRHELFFLAAGRNRWLASVRSCAALLRDVWYLSRGPAQGKDAHEGNVLLLVTLAGESGWGTLARSIDQLPIGRVTILAHPRLAAGLFPADLPLTRPARPSVQGFWAGLRVFSSHLVLHRSLLLASCLARRVLWRSSLSRTLAGRRGPVLLHNDFDIMSCAAINQGPVTLCLQHGLPTDEFFPTRANWYVVWGARSRQAFIDAGSPEPFLVEDALGRGNTISAPLVPPSGLSLLSQTHASILGAGLAGWLRDFADALLAAEPTMRILLHPQERQPYQGSAAKASSAPPHRELRPGCEPRLVLGCCTTALFDAALAGNWVVRLVAPLKGNEAARQVLAVPLEVQSAEQVMVLYERLCKDSVFRQRMAQAQEAWLRESFSQGKAGLSGLLGRLSAFTVEVDE